MRPRFSVRLLLAIVALMAVALYVLFVRPTVIANRFVEAVHKGEFDKADSLLLESGSFPELIQGRTRGNYVRHSYAEVLPREWSDIWAFRRRVLFRMSLQDDSGGRRIDWTEDTDLAAHWNGLEVIKFEGHFDSF